MSARKLAHRGTWLAGTGLAAAAAIAAVLVQGGSPASASTTIQLTRTQLLINQRISQAAVLRSNEALGLLSPVRPAPGQPTKILGWSAAHLRDGAVTATKLADASVTAAKLAPGAAGAPTAANERSAAGPLAVPTGAASLLRLALPAGNWMLRAKAYATSDGARRTVTCTLQAGTDADTILAGVAKDDPAPLALGVAHVFGAAGGSVDLTCSAPAPEGVGTALRAVRLSAIRVDTLAVTRAPN